MQVATAQPWHTAMAPEVTGALGVDNLGNEKYWAFHPYTQRTLVAELKFDL